VIRHIVLMKKRATTTPSQVASIEICLAALPGQVDGIASFELGVNNSPERLDYGYDLGFTMDFADVTSRDSYLPHPAHQACAELIGAVADDVLVFDFEF
jgi:hypothetical protein